MIYKVLKKHSKCLETKRFFQQKILTQTIFFLFLFTEDSVWQFFWIFLSMRWLIPFSRYETFDKSHPFNLKNFNFTHWTLMLISIFIIFIGFHVEIHYFHYCLFLENNIFLSDTQQTIQLFYLCY